MFFKRYYLNCLAHASYLIGDEDTGQAVVIDPQRDVDHYLADAAGEGLRLEHVFLTHFHADFLAGHLELAERTGARIHLGAAARPEYDAELMREGDDLKLGRLRLGILETPGHTPESICILLYDRAVSERNPHAVFTGDTLFIGDVGRPDLFGASGLSPRKLGGQLYDSIGKLLELPDATLVYPAHGAGSMCGKNLSSQTVSTIGEQRRTNAALQLPIRDDFVNAVASGQPPAPDYFPYDAVLNRRHRATLPTMLARALRPIHWEEVAADEVLQILDVRHADDFAAGHVRGSVNVGLDGRFATWAGAVLDPSREIVIVAEAGREAEAALRLGRIGFDRIRGYLAGGPDAVPEGQRRRLDRLELTELGNHPLRLMLDVRGPAECAARPVSGALQIPLPQLRRRLGEIPPDREVLVVCASGYRSPIAASLLLNAGRTSVSDLKGGWNAVAGA